MKKDFLIVVVTSFCVIFLDIVTKTIIEDLVQSHEVITVLPFLNIVNIKNTGAAFGVLADVNNNIFIIISVIAVFFVIVYLFQVSTRMERFSLSLVLGGAIGNLIDRLRIGKVIDFIDFFIEDWHWPAFNVADSALTVGILLFLLINIKQQKTRK